MILGERYFGCKQRLRIADMDRDQIIAKLRESASELKAAGVAHLFLHGSYAHGTEIRGSHEEHSVIRN